MIDWSSPCEWHQISNFKTDLIFLNFDENFEQARHGPRLDGITSRAKVAVRVGQFRNTAPLGSLDLCEVRRQDRHNEFLRLSPLLVPADESSKVQVCPQVVAYRPDPLRSLEKMQHLKYFGNKIILLLNFADLCKNLQMDHQMAVHKRTTMLAHCNLKQNTWLCSKQSSYFSFYALPLANQKTQWSIDWKHIRKKNTW